MTQDVQDAEQGSPAEGKGREATGCTALGAFMVLVGMSFIVLPLAEDRVVERVDLGGGVMVTLLGFGALLAAQMMRADARNERRIRQHGLRGHARIITCTPTGRLHNYRPVCTLELEVELPGRAAYQMTRNRDMPHDARKFDPGALLTVCVDRDDNDQIVFE